MIRSIQTITITPPKKDRVNTYDGPIWEYSDGDSGRHIPAKLQNKINHQIISLANDIAHELREEEILKIFQDSIQTSGPGGLSSYIDVGSSLPFTCKFGFNRTTLNPKLSGDSFSFDPQYFNHNSEYYDLVYINIDKKAYKIVSYHTEDKYFDTVNTFKTSDYSGVLLAGIIPGGETIFEVTVKDKKTGEFYVFRIKSKDNEEDIALQRGRLSVQKVVLRADSTIKNAQKLDTKYKNGARLKARFSEAINDFDGISINDSLIPRSNITRVILVDENALSNYEDVKYGTWQTVEKIDSQFLSQIPPEEAVGYIRDILNDLAKNNFITNIRAFSICGFDLPREVLNGLSNVFYIFKIDIDHKKMITIKSH